MRGETDLLAAALARHQAGDLEAAEQGYRGVLARDPRQVKAWKMLGVLARDSGCVGQAIDCLQAALECAGPEPRLYFHLAQAYAGNNDLDGAIRAYRQSLTLDECAEGALQTGGRAGSRRISPRGHRTFQPQPGTRRGSGRHPFQIGGHTRRRRTSPRRRVRLSSAVGRLARPRPGLFESCALLQDLGRLDEAIACYRRAIAADSRCAEAHFNLGTALALGRDFMQSAAALEQAVGLRPEFAEAYSRLGDSLAAQGKLAAAREQLGKAALLRPRRLAWALKTEVVCPWIFADNNEIDAYRARLCDRLSEWSRVEWEIDLAELQAAGSPPPAQLAYQGRDDKPLKSLFAGLFAGRLPAPRFKRSSGRPRIVFVVTPGHEAIFLRGMAGLINQLDTRQLEITVTCGAAAKGQLAGQIRNPKVESCVLPTDMSQAHRVLGAGRFDLAYFWEVGTDALNYFLPLLRIAPIQCTSWGWPVTSGIPELDFFISSDQIEPPGAEQHYSERLVRLKHIPHVYSRPDMEGISADRTRFGFAAEHVYLCPQNPRKFHPDFDPLIGGILRRSVRHIRAAGRFAASRFRRTWCAILTRLARRGGPDSGRAANDQGGLSAVASDGRRRAGYPALRRRSQHDLRHPGAGQAAGHLDRPVPSRPICLGRLSGDRFGRTGGDDAGRLCADRHPAGHRARCTH